MSVKLCKEGDHFAIETNCKDSVAFVEEFSLMLSKLIDGKEYDNDWEFQLRGWLPQFLDICNAMNGYKNTVRKETVYHVGGRVASNGWTHVHELDMEKETAPATANGFRSE